MSFCKLNHVDCIFKQTTTTHHHTKLFKYGIPLMSYALCLISNDQCPIRPFHSTENPLNLSLTLKQLLLVILSNQLSSIIIKWMIYVNMCIPIIYTNNIHICIISRFFPKHFALQYLLPISWVVNQRIESHIFLGDLFVQNWKVVLKGFKNSKCKVETEKSLLV